MTTFRELAPDDRSLIEAAKEVLRRNYHPERHTVGAALRCASGPVYSGVNIEACGYGPCAEVVALGTAISRGERELLSIVAVSKKDDGFAVLPPCGNCRQLFVDYAPGILFILEHRGSLGKTEVRNLLVEPYAHFDESG